MTTARPRESLNDCRRRANIADAGILSAPAHAPAAYGNDGRHLSRRAEIGGIIASGGSRPAAIVRLPALC
jgi:hypothetical protein